MTKPSLPVWSVRVVDLPPGGRELAIRADAGQRRAIAEAYGVKDIECFEARLRVQPWGRGGARTSGRLEAELTQACVVSLRPVRERIDEEFVRAFVPPEMPAALARGRPGARPGKTELVVELDQEDPPEPLTGGVVDLAAVLLEQFALALDPYPRHPEAVSEEAPERGAKSPEDSPFAILRGRPQRGREPSG